MPPQRRWNLPRNCALTPRQALCGYALAGALMLPHGLVAAWLGYPVIALFVGVQLLALLAALLAHARHAADTETLVLDQRTLRIEQRSGDVVHQACLDRHWLRVGLERGRDPLVVLSSHGDTVAVGRHLVVAHRERLAAELRAALAA